MMLLMLLAGLLTFCIGGLMLLIAAFSVSVWWGIFCIFFPPVNLLFVLLNWSKARRPLLVQLLGIVLMVAAALMMDDFLALLRNHPFSHYQSYSWSSTTASPAASASLPTPGIHSCRGKDGKVIYTNKPCLAGESTVIDPQATKDLPALPESQFKCDGRTHCSQMTSCEEAKFFIQHCPNTEMDGDHDGVPCESQWCSNSI